MTIFRVHFLGGYKIDVAAETPEEASIKAAKQMRLPRGEIRKIKKVK